MADLHPAQKSVVLHGDIKHSLCVADIECYADTELQGTDVLTISRSLDIWCSRRTNDHSFSTYVDFVI